MDEDFIETTPVSAPEPTSKHKRKIYNINDLKNLVHYPGELLEPKHPSAFQTRNYAQNQKETHFMRMICEIIELKTMKFRFPNVTTVGIYQSFKKSTHLKDDVTGHRIELDFSNQIFGKIPQMFTRILITGRVKHKNFHPFIMVSFWEEWTGKTNFQEFYYNIRRFRSPQVDETIPIDNDKTSSDNDDMSQDEDFEKTAFFDNLIIEGLLDDDDDCFDVSYKSLFDE